jgi:hypothetical protein
MLLPENIGSSGKYRRKCRMRNKKQQNERIAVADYQFRIQCSRFRALSFKVEVKNQLPYTGLRCRLNIFNS